MGDQVLEHTDLDLRVRDAVRTIPGLAGTEFERLPTPEGDRDFPACPYAVLYVIEIDDPQDDGRLMPVCYQATAVGETFEQARHVGADIARVFLGWDEGAPDYNVSFDGPELTVVGRWRTSTPASDHDSTLLQVVQRFVLLTAAT